MATLNELIDEQNRIARKLQDLADDPDATEEGDGNLRDTLIHRWEEIEPQRKKLTEELERLNVIKRRAAEDSANTESGDGGGGPQVSRYGQGPEFMQRRDPLADREASRDYTLLSGGDLVARASTLVEQHDRRQWLPGRGEAATRAAQAPSIARHMLMYGGDEYYEAFREYVNDPTGPGLQRAAGALTLASAQGGFFMVAAA
jgi:hypothetical protein